jgi:6-phosphogluconolactonase
MRTRYLQGLLLSLPIILASGCGSSNNPTKTTPIPSCTPASPPAYAYVLNDNIDTISMYTVDSCTGDLTAMAPASIPTGANNFGSESMAVDPAGRFVYVANLGSNATDLGTISMFTIDQGTGALTATTPPTVPTGFLPQGIGIDPSGKFVYTANSDDNTISMFTINSNTGVLTPTSPPTVATGWSPLSITIDPSGRFAYAANQDDGTVSMYTVNSSTGVLTPTTPASVPAGGSPFGVTVDPSSSFAYVPNAYGNNEASEYTIDSITGVLIPTVGIAATTGNSPTSVAVDLSGKFAYIVNRMDNTVWSYTIDRSTGNLALSGTVSTGVQPFRVVVDPSSKFVYVANESGSVSIYKINSDGTLATGPKAETGGVVVDVGITPLPGTKK